jgi:hypothetical protein
LNRWELYVALFESKEVSSNPYHTTGSRKSMDATEICCHLQYKNQKQSHAVGFSPNLQSARAAKIALSTRLFRVWLAAVCGPRYIRFGKRIPKIKIHGLSF